MLGLFVFSSGRSFLRFIFLCSYLNGVIAVSPVFFLSFGSLLIIPGTPSCCYISICMWFIDIRVWRNLSTHLVHVKMNALSQTWGSWSRFCFGCDRGKEAGAGCRGSPCTRSYSPANHKPGVFLYSSGDNADDALESQDGLGLGWKGPFESLFKRCLCLFCIPFSLAKKAFQKRLHRI